VTSLWWVEEVGLDRLTAALSEGFCPRCHTRLRQDFPFPLRPGVTPDDFGPGYPAYARGHCATCCYWLMAGHGGSDGRDWFAVVFIASSLITFILNPPPDDDW